MCHCIFFGINPHVNVSLKYHDSSIYRATWWPLGLNSKEDFVFHCANCWFERWRGRSLSDSQHSHTAMSSSCGNKCAHRRRSIADQQEVQQGTVAQVTQGQHSGCCCAINARVMVFKRHAGSWSLVNCLARSLYEAFYKVLMNIN